jgi:rabenosyn-5
VTTSLAPSSSTKAGSTPTTSKWTEQSLMNISFQNLSLVGSNNNPTFFVSDTTDRQGDFVTRDHWQRETGNDICNIPGCLKVVGKSGGAGKQHCRK